MASFTTENLEAYPDFAEFGEFAEFTETEAENLEFVPEDLESLEAESMESVNLENVNPESVAQALEASMQGMNDGYGAHYNYGSYGTSSTYVNRQIVKTLTVLVRLVIKKARSNPRTRAKLQAATRQGPTAVARLITPSVSKVLPSYFRWMIPMYVPSIIRTLFGAIRKEVGIKAEEVEATAEWSPEWDFAGN